MSATSTTQHWEVTEPYLNLHCGLGEGPYYERASNSLRFVDIKKRRLHTVDLSQGPDSVTTVEIDGPVGVTADIEGADPQQKLLVAAKLGIAILDRTTGEYEYIAKYDGAADGERLRSNDGAVDPDGRFWVGTMTDFGLGPFKQEGKRPPNEIPSVAFAISIPDGPCLFYKHLITVA
jgi:sugar lactone lactonase YvrE